MKGFPTIKLFKNGVPSDYEGGRTEAEIVSWTAKRSGPPAKELFLEADLIAMQAQHDGSDSRILRTSLYLPHVMCE